MHNNEGKGKPALFSFTCTPQQFFFLLYFYFCFPSTSSTQHRPHIHPISTPHRLYIDLPTSTFPPPHFYCFPSSSSFSFLFFYLFLLLLLNFKFLPAHFYFFSQTGDLEGQAGQTQAKKAKHRPKRPTSGRNRQNQAKSENLLNNLSVKKKIKKNEEEKGKQ